MNRHFQKKEISLILATIRKFDRMYKDEDETSTEDHDNRRKTVVLQVLHLRHFERTPEEVDYFFNVTLPQLNNFKAGIRKNASDKMGSTTGSICSEQSWTESEKATDNSVTAAGINSCLPDVMPGTAFVGPSGSNNKVENEKSQAEDQSKHEMLPEREIKLAAVPASSQDPSPTGKLTKAPITSLEIVKNKNLKIVLKDDNQEDELIESTTSVDNYVNLNKVLTNEEEDELLQEPATSVEVARESTIGNQTKAGANLTGKNVSQANQNEITSKSSISNETDVVGQAVMTAAQPEDVKVINSKKTVNIMGLSKKHAKDIMCTPQEELSKSKSQDDKNSSSAPDQDTGSLKKNLRNIKTSSDNKKLPMRRKKCSETEMNTVLDVINDSPARKQPGKYAKQSKKEEESEGDSVGVENTTSLLNGKQCDAIAVQQPLAGTGKPDAAGGPAMVGHNNNNYNKRKVTTPIVKFVNKRVKGNPSDINQNMSKEKTKKQPVADTPAVVETSSELTDTVKKLRGRPKKEATELKIYQRKNAKTIKMVNDKDSEENVANVSKVCSSNCENKQTWEPMVIFPEKPNYEPIDSGTTNLSPHKIGVSTGSKLKTYQRKNAKMPKKVNAEECRETAASTGNTSTLAGDQPEHTVGNSIKGDNNRDLKASKSSPGKSKNATEDINRNCSDIEGENVEETIWPYVFKKSNADESEVKLAQVDNVMSPSKSVPGGTMKQRTNFCLCNEKVCICIRKTEVDDVENGRRTTRSRSIDSNVSSDKEKNLPCQVAGRIKVKSENEDSGLSDASANMADFDTIRLVLKRPKSKNRMAYLRRRTKAYKIKKLTNARGERGLLWIRNSMIPVAYKPCPRMKRNIPCRNAAFSRQQPTVVRSSPPRKCIITYNKYRDAERNERLYASDNHEPRPLGTITRWGTNCRDNKYDYDDSNANWEVVHRKAMNKKARRHMRPTDTRCLTRVKIESIKQTDSSQPSFSRQRDPALQPFQDRIVRKKEIKTKRAIEETLEEDIVLEEEKKVSLAPSSSAITAEDKKRDVKKNHGVVPEKKKKSEAATASSQDTSSKDYYAAQDTDNPSEPTTIDCLQADPQRRPSADNSSSDATPVVADDSDAIEMEGDEIKPVSNQCCPRNKPDVVDNEQDSYQNPSPPPSPERQVPTKSSSAAQCSLSAAQSLPPTAHSSPSVPLPDPDTSDASRQKTLSDRYQAQRRSKQLRCKSAKRPYDRKALASRDQSSLDMLFRFIREQSIQQMNIQTEICRNLQTMTERLNDLSQNNNLSK